MEPESKPDDRMGGLSPEAMEGRLRARLRTPRAAAIAGIIFAVLLITSLLLLRSSATGDLAGGSAWLRTSVGRVALAINMVPFAGIAFLWFIGVLRDRLGEREDQFFATVFLGSGILFLALIFLAAAIIAALILAHAAHPELDPDQSFAFPRALAYGIMHIYAFRMAAVFMISTSTLALRTRVTARWIALLGYGAAAFLLLGSGFVDWVLFVFPAWVLLVSVYILIDNVRSLKRPEKRLAPINHP